MSFQAYAKTSFSGCHLFCLVEAGAMFPEQWIRVYQIPDCSQKYYGAVYPDGASMIWPCSWLTSHKKRVKGPFKYGARARLWVKPHTMSSSGPATIKRVVLHET